MSRNVYAEIHYGVILNEKQMKILDKLGERISKLPCLEDFLLREKIPLEVICLGEFSESDDTLLVVKDESLEDISTMEGEPLNITGKSFRQLPKWETFILEFLKTNGVKLTAKQKIGWWLTTEYR